MCFRIYQLQPSYYIIPYWNKSLFARQGRFDQVIGSTEYLGFSFFTSKPFACRCRFNFFFTAQKEHCFPESVAFRFSTLTTPPPQIPPPAGDAVLVRWKINACFWVLCKQ